MTLSCAGKCGIGMGPYLFAQAIFAFTYTVYVFRFIWGLFENGDTATAVILLFLFHLVFVMAQVSYFLCAFTDPGGIPDGFPDAFENKAENDSESSMAFMVETNTKGERRKCSKCAKVKPDRSHHCSTCKRCILKMDHHCPWVNNCVGFFNYKYFILFLTWTVLICTYTAASVLKQVITYFTLGTGADVLVVAVFIIMIVFGLGLGAFAGSHYIYILSNRTTIEALEKSSTRKYNIYNLGNFANFQQIFGTNPLLWFIPVFTSRGNGLSFPQNLEGNSLLA